MAFVINFYYEAYLYFNKHTRNAFQEWCEKDANFQTVRSFLHQQYEEHDDLEFTSTSQIWNVKGIY